MVPRGSAGGRPGSRARQGRKPDDDRPAVWAAYGKLLKLFREKAGMSQEALAEAVGYSYEQTASIEQGRRPAKARFTEQAEEVLGAGGVLAALQVDVDLARLPRFFQNFKAMEAEALSRFSYDPLLIPGLLQTEEYANVLLHAHFPPLDEEVIEELVSARMERQALFHRANPPMVFVFIMEESALRRPVGGAAVLKAQLQHLLVCAQLRNVEIQIMPTARAAHSGLNGSMVLLETVECTQVAYLEAQGVGTVISDRKEVSEFSMRYGMLRSQALDTDGSTRLIEQVVGEL
ncbi:helix-turn-helix domain-containing protein [Streptomyces sp. NPDC057136]|uniref:helix-turn-helix domain-containing protein n=1 Tax=Streptomyces sp. NPDC057136 TaxID=3346029 RepID=UPI00363F190F